MAGDMPDHRQQDHHAELSTATPALIATTARTRGSVA